MDKKTINIDLKPKEWQLIKFLRDSFKYGDLKLVVYNHEPVDIVILEPRIHLDGNCPLTGIDESR